MFITKGIISLFGSKTRGLDINNLPDLDSSDDIHKFLSSLKSEIHVLNFNEDLRVLAEFLVDISEKYQIETYVKEDWVKVLNSSASSPLLQSLLDISLNISERDSSLFDVNFI